MADSECVELLQWALPRLDLRWTGFRNVRGQVCKRIRRRIAQLGLRGFGDYRARLDADPAEWRALDGLCRVTISRFYRDRGVWDAMRDDVLPELARAAMEAGEKELRCWSVGCASGEEPYTLCMVWALAVAGRFPGLALRVLATDMGEDVLGRAREATYPAATLRDLPAGWRERAFERDGDLLRVRPELRATVELRREDIRRALPEGPFRLILCRNLVFTYFDEALQRETLDRLLAKLSPGGAFVIGRRERLPPGAALVPRHPALGIFTREPVGNARAPPSLRE
jgi:chemotaxis protein methyltransferase CheR